jgi:hypothetical protein
MSTVMPRRAKAKQASTATRTPQQERIRIRAARLRVTTDQKLGQETPEWIRELAKKPL